jgi:Cu(I)/Ag(I) efflux system membrane fusion protein
MKRISTYILILAAGLFLGWLLFGPIGQDKVNTLEQEQAVISQWTCSMHPQIVLPEQGSCPICGMDLIPQESGGGTDPNEIKMTANAVALANIQTELVGSGTGGSSILALSGRIRPNEKKNATQTAHFGGRIEQLFVAETGTRLQAGTLLARIYSPELVAAQQELLTAIQLKDSDPAIYQAVRNKLRLWKLTDDQIVEIERSGTVMKDFAFYADLDGVVIEKLVEEGDHVMEGQGLFLVSDLSSVWAEFDIYENQLSLVKVGDVVHIQSNAWPQDEIEARINFIDPVLNEKTRTVAARATLVNRENRLKPGMFISGELQGANFAQDNLLTVPKTSVLWTGERSVVYVQKDPSEPVFEMRSVTLGQELGDSYQVLDGLRPGERVVTHGAFTVDAAAQLQGSRSMMNADTSEPDNDARRDGEIDKDFQSQLRPVLDSYLSLKDELVGDRNIEVSTLSAQLLDRVSAVQPSNDEAGNWLDLANKITEAGSAIVASYDIEVARQHFLAMSDAVIASVERYGVGQTVYKQFCPMANNDQGGFWLSWEEEILNPYFGASMLRCGNIESIIEY